MELNNLQKNETPYFEEYQYIPSVDINRSLNYVEAGIFFTFFLIKGKGIDKMISNFLTDVESKVLNECENRQLNKVEYEDNKLHYGCFNSLFKHYYSISLNANRDSFQEHKNWILETLISEIKKSNNIIDKYKLILDFKRGLFETLEFIHLIGGYEKILGEKETKEKIKLRGLEMIERKRREKIEIEELEIVQLEKQKQDKLLSELKESSKLIHKYINKTEKTGGLNDEINGVSKNLKPGRKRIATHYLYAVKYKLIHLFYPKIEAEDLKLLSNFYKKASKREGIKEGGFTNAFRKLRGKNDVEDYLKKHPYLFEEFKKQDLLKEYPLAKKFVDDFKFTKEK